MGSTLIVASGTHMGHGSHYLCRFAADDRVHIVPATFRDASSVSCKSPAVVEDVAVDYDFSLALNGQQFTEPAPVVFGFHGDSTVKELSPASGP
eukprot:1734457-Prymnesium_polylepis.1